MCWPFAAWLILNLYHCFDEKWRPLNMNKNSIATFFVDFFQLFLLYQSFCIYVLDKYFMEVNKFVLKVLNIKLQQVSVSCFIIKPLMDMCSKKKYLPVFNNWQMQHKQIMPHNITIEIACISLNYSNFLECWFKNMPWSKGLNCFRKSFFLCTQ